MSIEDVRAGRVPPVVAIRAQIANRIGALPFYLREYRPLLEMLDAYVAEVDDRIATLEGRIKPSIAAQLMVPVPESERRPEKRCISDDQPCTRGCIGGFCARDAQGTEDLYL